MLNNSNNSEFEEYQQTVKKIIILFLIELYMSFITQLKQAHLKENKIKKIIILLTYLSLKFHLQRKADTSVSSKTIQKTRTVYQT